MLTSHTTSHRLTRGAHRRFDRRDFPRRRLSMHVIGRRMDHAMEARLDPCLHLALTDVSMGGLGAVSQTPLSVGERIAVFFPPEGASRGWDAYGRVVRVEPGRIGCRIGVRLDSVAAI